MKDALAGAVKRIAIHQCHHTHLRTLRCCEETTPQMKSSPNSSSPTFLLKGKSKATPCNRVKRAMTNSFEITATTRSPGLGSRDLSMISSSPFLSSNSFESEP